jgi:phosphatidylinositol-3-phosphatase
MRSWTRLLTTLRNVRLSHLQLAAVTAVSLAATVVVIVNGNTTANGTTRLESAVLAALDKRVVVHHVAAPSNASAGDSSAGAGAGGGGSDSGGSSGSGGSGSGSGSAGSGSGGNGGSGDGGGGDDSGTTDTTTTTTTTTSSTTTTTTPAPKTYNVKHVFVISLSTPSYAAAFGKKSVAKYLTGTLVKKGTLLSGYKTLPDSSELGDELAMVSGQAPNADTRGDCATYAEFPSSAKTASNGDVSGDGCIYPDTALTIGDQVTSSGKFWGAYVEDEGSQPCVHPNSGAADDAALPGAGAEYDTRHNPFIYFHSLLDLGDCATDDLALTALPKALRSTGNTPEYSFIAPDACDDASATTCTGGDLSGLAGENAFLATWVPQILSSPAYKKDGMLLILFTTPGPAAASSPKTSKAVRTGALVLSKYAAAGSTVKATYNPYSVLVSIEDLFDFTPLAHAKGAKSFLSAALSGS